MSVKKRVSARRGEGEGVGGGPGRGRGRGRGLGNDAVTLIAVDTGGTFTDVVCLHAGALHIVKVPSTPADPSSAVLKGIKEVLALIPASAPAPVSINPAPTSKISPPPPPPPFVLIHGSTVATNALLERRGSPVALVTNRGFEDVLEIGRQTRPQLYALSGWRKPPLVPPEDRIGICGRIGPGGEELEAIDPGELSQLGERIRAADGVQAIAVCLLHSYGNASHEAAVGTALEDLGLPVSLSHVVLREYREYERCSTTVVNAYVAPLMSSYLERLQDDAGASRVRIMGSGGGAIPVAAARREPVQTVLSGPAGGVAGALGAARQAGFDRIVTFDMGGTSTDVSICPGRILHTRELTIDGLPVAIPVIDIHTVGAGGGSIAWLDAGGALRVGPRSAGAQPGPICYGRGGPEVTVTDAQVWLNRLPADAFLGGTALLDRASIEQPLTLLARQLGSDPEHIAEGVIEVVNTSMESALRVITVERGHDPVDCTLVAFGGAAGLHAAELATRLGVARVLLPRDPGLLSAHGMLVSPVRKDAARTVLIRSDRLDAAEVEEQFTSLERTVLDAMTEDEVRLEDVTLVRFIDARYRGQSFELQVPAASWLDSFHDAHRQRYGYAQPDAVVEAVTLRVSGSAALPVIPTVRIPASRGPAKPQATGTVIWRGKSVRAGRFARDRLKAGQQIHGPAIITEYSATTWLPPDWRIDVDRWGNLILVVN
ncbi:MAG: hydantoinase/oxoprolinase family protein [Gemmatimonadota bacterium]